MAKSQFQVNGRAHNYQCELAKHKKCTCSCGGRYHGYQVEQLEKEHTVKQAKNFKVGDIVICHGRESIEGRKGFIEEVIVDAGGRFKPFGKFSIYGLEYATFLSDESLYFGDFNGDDLEPTGESMTVETLEQYKKKEPHNKGLIKDIDIVKQNLGRTSGRNSPSREVSQWA